MENVQPPKSHILMDIIMDASNEAILVSSADEFPSLFIEVNKRACELLGYCREELLQKCAQDIAMPEESAMMKVRMQELFEKRKLLFETMCVPKNGPAVPVEVSASLVTLDGKNIIVTLVREIAERKHMEMQLRESEERFRQAFETTAIGMSIASLDGKILKTNQALCDMLGYNQQELTGKYFQEVSFPEDLAQEMELLRELLNNTRTNYSLEKRCIHKQGGIVWADLCVSIVRDNQNSPLYLVAHIANITMRKRIEEALRESEERYRALIANIPGVVFRCAVDRERTMSFISEEIARLSGFPVEDFVDNSKRTFESIIHPEDRSQMAEHIQGALKNRVSYTVEYRIIDEKGNIHWLREKGQGMYDAIGNILWIDGVLFDVTARKYMEIEVQKRVIEMERFQAVTIEREKRIIELKEKVKQLEFSIHEQK